MNWDLFMITKWKVYAAWNDLWFRLANNMRHIRIIWPYAAIIFNAQQSKLQSRLSMAWLSDQARLTCPIERTTRVWWPIFSMWYECQTFCSWSAVSLTTDRGEELISYHVTQYIPARNWIVCTDDKNKCDVISRWVTSSAHYQAGVCRVQEVRELGAPGTPDPPGCRILEMQEFDSVAVVQELASGTRCHSFRCSWRQKRRILAVESCGHATAFTLTNDRDYQLITSWLLIVIINSKSH